MGRIQSSRSRGQPDVCRGGEVAPNRDLSTILAYKDHRHRLGAASATQRLLTVDQWRALSADGGRIGLFFSCGCHSTDFEPSEEALGVAATSAPGGPAAVMGSQGETYAAMGVLAMSGMHIRMSAEAAPRTVGEFWQGVQPGLREGAISVADFKTLDSADGSGGKIPLEIQRLEHLESRVILGDPAMPLSPQPLEIKLTAKAAETDGEIEIMGELPPSLASAKIRLAVERHPSEIRPDLPAVPPKGEPRREAIRKRRALSKDMLFATKECTAEGASFTTTISVPSTPANAPHRPCPDCRCVILRVRHVLASYRKTKCCVRVNPAEQERWHLQMHRSTLGLRGRQPIHYHRRKVFEVDLGNAWWTY